MDCFLQLSPQFFICPPPFNSVTKRNLFLCRKILGQGAFTSLAPSPPQIYTYDRNSLFLMGCKNRFRFWLLRPLFLKFSLLPFDTNGRELTVQNCFTTPTFSNSVTNKSTGHRYGKIVPVHPLNVYGRVEEQLISFLTLSPYGGEWSTARPGSFTPPP